MSNRITRTKNRLLARIASSQDEREKLVCQTLIQAYNSGSIQASTWVLLANDSIIYKIVSEIPLESQQTRPEASCVWSRIEPVLKSIVKEVSHEN